MQTSLDAVRNQRTGESPLSAIDITHADIEPVLTRHEGNHLFRKTVEGIRDGDEMLRVLGRYILVNAPFAGGVANLAGEIAVRRDLFRDPEEPIDALADRSTRVAADVFYACVDEFQDRTVARRDTHRSLAQATLKGMGQFYRRSPEEITRLTAPTAGILADMDRVMDGYGLNQPVTEEKLFRAMGFHAGSEILADEEFRLLDEALRAHHADLVTYLESTETAVGETRHPAYFWVKIHTSVEADHFDFAMRGANDALKYYAGSRSREEVKATVLAGFREFASVQQSFMEHLTGA
jgi:hypothetical protein